MGAWGYQNLENDTAQDILGEVCDDYFRRITDALRSAHGHEYDEYEHDELFVLAETVLALSERGMVNSAPDPEVLRPLFAPFIERWAAYHQHVGGSAPAERRRVMEESFGKLIQVAERACQGSFEHRVALIMDKMSRSRTGADLPPQPPLPNA